MKIEDRNELRREIAAIIWGTDARDASIVAEKIVKFLEDKKQMNKKDRELLYTHNVIITRLILELVEKNILTIEESNRLLNTCIDISKLNKKLKKEDRK
jgi:hypothetical protein